MGGSVGNSVRRGKGAEPDHLKSPKSLKGGYTPCAIKAIARPLRASWKEAPAGPPKPGQQDNDKRYGKVQGSVGEERHGICGMPAGLARRHNGGPPVEGDLGREPWIE